jgi:hypothetical protein
MGVSEVAATMQATMDVPPEISTGCKELDLVWRLFGPTILDRPGILILDTDDDLTWHAFLGHSIDMTGFRAAEFAGVDALTKHAPNFRSLRQRGLGVPELAALWEVPPIRKHLLTGAKGTPLRTTLDVLRLAGGAHRGIAGGCLRVVPMAQGTLVSSGSPPELFRPGGP